MEPSEVGGQTFRNRKTGLVIFGVVEILLGCLCVLFCLLVLSVGLMGEGAAAKAGSMPGKGSVLLALTMYGGLAVFFVWMGLGSIKGRRWARALMLVVSIWWLIVGTLTTLFLAFIMPHMISAAMAGTSSEVSGQAAAGAVTVVMAFTISFVALFMVVVPGVLFLFYRSPHVKATCERMDPKERWTDRVPLAVLALSMLLAWGGMSLLFMLSAPAVPAFGLVLKGPLALTAMLVTTVAMWVFAVNIYRRRRWAWTAVLALTLLGYLSTFITFARMSSEQLMETSGVRVTAANAQAFTAMIPPLEIMMAVSMLVYLAFLLYVLRYFKQPPAAPGLESPGRESQEA
jgi:hypothetical protein